MPLIPAIGDEVRGAEAGESLAQGGPDLQRIPLLAII